MHFLVATTLLPRSAYTASKVIICTATKEIHAAVKVKLQLKGTIER